MRARNQSEDPGCIRRAEPSGVYGEALATGSETGMFEAFRASDGGGDGLLEFFARIGI